MTLRDEKPQHYAVNPRIIQKTDMIEKWIAEGIDDLVYDAYMAGRHDQLVSDIYLWMRENGESFKSVIPKLLPRLPPEYKVTEEEIEQFAMNFNTGYYASLIKTARRLIQSKQEDFEHIIRLLKLNEYDIKIYQVAENVEDEKLEQFVWTYLQKEKPPSLLLREESN